MYLKAPNITWDRFWSPKCLLNCLPDAVGKIGREESVVSVLGGAPVRHVEVVAEAVDGPVPLDLALGRHEEGRAVLLHDGAGGVDQRETVGHRVLREAVLLGQEPSGLVNHGAEVADILQGMEF